MTARARLLLFLDDDIDACSDLLVEHVAAHRTGTPSACVGYLPPVARHGTRLFDAAVVGWWHQMFDRMSRPGHQFSFRDVLTGNLSLPADLFHRAGRFEPLLQCHEDYELGARLLKMGVSLRFLSGAAGIHHESSNLERALRRKYDEGRADVLMTSLHPDLAAVLPLAAMPSRLVRLLRQLHFHAPIAGRVATWLLRRYVEALDLLKVRTTWQARLDTLMGSWYWRGVADEAGSWARVAHILATAAQDNLLTDAPALTMDLARGVDAVEHDLDWIRPRHVRLTYGTELVGDLRTPAGTEPLRGSHLRPRLLAELGAHLLRAMTSTGAIPDAIDRRWIAGEVVSSQ
jgi:hypothetical protein